MILIVWPVCLYDNYYAWTIGKKSGWNWRLKINLKLPYYQEKINERLLEYIHPTGERDKMSWRKIVRNLGMTGKTLSWQLVSVFGQTKKWRFVSVNLCHSTVTYKSCDTTLPRVPQRIWASLHLTTTNGGYPSEPPGLFLCPRSHESTMFLSSVWQ